MLLVVNQLIILALCVSTIHCLNVTCDNALDSYSKFDDICYVKEIKPSMEVNEKINFLLSYTTPDKIYTVDIYTSDSQSGINYIPTEVFDFFPNLNTLRVNSRVATISSNDLQKGKKLTSLGISNELQKISKGTFSVTVNLKFLSLHSNKISEIEDYAFEGLKQLFSLELEHNHLSTIHRNIFFGLEELHVLNLYDNQIQTIEDLSFQHLTKLEYLRLHRNKLKILSDNVFVGLVNLREISLQNNQLNRIHNSLYGLQSVAKIDLSFNDITDVNSNEFAKLSKLTALDLFNSGYLSNVTTMKQ